MRWFRRNRDAERDAELDAELEAHLRMAAEERIARGESPSEARRAARREFGNVGLVKEVTREMWGGASLGRLVQDIRYALRGLRRNPGFAIVALLTLALGIGANSAVFTVVHGVLLRPLPFREPERLFFVSYMPPNVNRFAGPSLQDAEYVAYRRAQRSFEQLATFHTDQMTLTGRGDPRRVQVALVTPDFFPLLGVAPAIGRPFAADEGQAGREQLALLGDGIWRDRFAADPAIVGKTIVLDAKPFIVLGVMPPVLRYPVGADVWLPLEVRVSEHLTRARPVIGRLRAERTAEQATAELATIAKAFSHIDLGDTTARVAVVRPLKHLLVGNVEKSLLIFSGAVGFVLLIACANVANLLLMRAAAREQEMALRTALGASRIRLVRQLLTESAIISLAGGVLGVLVAAVGVRALLALAPAGRIPRGEEVMLDGPVLAFTIAVAVGTGLLFGLVPALQGTRRAPRSALNQGARTYSAPGGGVRAALVVTEVALAMVLLAGAGLMMRSFLAMRAVDVGFQPEQVVSMTVDLPETRYPTPELMQRFHAQTLGRLATLPGVVTTGAVNWRPLGDALIQGDFTVDRGTPEKCHCLVAKPVVSPDYFATMGIRVLSGRAFTDRDDAHAPRVVIVSQSVAKRIWPRKDAVGQRVAMTDTPKPEDWYTVIGVVNDVIQETLTSEPAPAMYQPYTQARSAFFLGHMTFVVRTTGAEGTTAAAMRGVLGDIDRDQPVQALGGLHQLIAGTIAEPLFQTRLLATFSMLALLLSAIGIYGVLAYAVSERTREIGIRMALGAVGGEVMRMILRRTLVLVLPGIIIGTAGALLLTRVLTHFLFGVTATDPTTFASVAALLVAVALVAALVPARRASRVDPLVALRGE
jgi:putative ABC transport system permease protein